VEDLRSQFPVLERLAYLNAGSNGPVPRRALDAVAESLERQAVEGRGDKAHFEENAERIDHLRGRIAAVLGCDTSELALTGSTTDGVNATLLALDLGPGDDVLTSDEEHPGVLAPLAALRERRGVEARMVPFGELAAEVRPETKLVACSHVSWRTGAVVDAAALAATDALVLLDGAQGLGAVPTRVAELGCDFYAASGQKWLCGPNGIGYLYARGELASTLPPPWPNYGVLADSSKAFDLPLHPDARRFSIGFPAPHQVEWAIAGLDVLEEAGLDAVHARARELAAVLAERLGARTAPRGDSTLVSWEDADPEAAVARLRDEGFVVRHLPATPYVRASVGAWNSEDEVERLAESATR
jgi:selenocysteine lyase/cysteine desulfurase